MPAGGVVHASLQLLGHPLVDRNGVRCGEVDDLELAQVPETGQLHVTAIVGQAGRIPFGHVADVGARVTLRLEHAELPQPTVPSATTSGATMRMSELLESSVVDREERPIGSVDDVRLVPAGPLVEGVGAALRVEGLVVGHGGLARRLGAYRHAGRRRSVVRWLAPGMERRGRFVRWVDVDRWSDGVVRLLVDRRDLLRLTEVD